MPEYLYPGVYVEEISSRAKPIEGVSTSTVGMVGLCLTGPIKRCSAPLTSVADFEQAYGAATTLSLAGLAQADRRNLNYLAHSVRAFFENGGSRLFVSRVFHAADTAGEAASPELFESSEFANACSIRVVARSPGVAGNAHVTLTLTATAVANGDLAGLPAGTLLRVVRTGESASYFEKASDLVFRRGDAVLSESDLNGQLDALSLTIAIVSSQPVPSFPPLMYDGLGFGRNHPQYVATVLASEPADPVSQLTSRFAVLIEGSIDAELLCTSLFPRSTALRELELAGGNDGAEPTPDDFRDALASLANVEEVAVVTAPGSAVFTSGIDIAQQVVAHVERARAYRFAVLDSPPAADPAQVVAFKSTVESSYVALYYPWVIATNATATDGSSSEVELPPSGFVAGVYARVDRDGGVFHAPANEILSGALRLEREIAAANQGLLNPQGVSCLRHFPDRGIRVWGARTTSSDPEWKYVNLRRYFIYLEHSIESGTQWAVFEKNGPALWTVFRDRVADFLFREWKAGALEGIKPDEAYFVRCDETTMTQDDIDAGRLICMIGVAAITAAEFVIFRIQRQTSDTA